MSGLPAFPKFTYENSPANRAENKVKGPQSCTECRRRKSKCDRNFPCTQCNLRGDAALCVEYQKAPNDGWVGYTQIADFDLLVARFRSVEAQYGRRIDALERQLHGFRGKAPEGAYVPYEEMVSGRAERGGEGSVSDRSSSSDDGMDDPVSHHIPVAGPSRQPIPAETQRPAKPTAFTSEDVDGTPRLLRVQSRRRPDLDSRAPSIAEHQGTMFLEDLVFSRTANVGREVREGSAGSSSLGGANGRAEGGVGMGRKPKTCMVEGLRNCRNRFCWIVYYCISCGCLHLPSFIQQCQQVLSNPIRNPMSIENAAFLSLLAACLCVTVHLMEDASAVELGLSPMARDSLAADLNAIMESAWQRGDFMQNHRMEFLQAYIIIGHYWGSMNRSEAHWTYLGMAIKVAQNLGLCDLGPEPAPDASTQAIRRLYGARWQSLRDREIGRRVWWSLVELDLQFAAEHHYKTITWSRQYTTVFPLNYADDDLHDKYARPPASPEIYTSSSYLIAKFQWIIPLRTLIEKVQESHVLRYSYVEQIHDEYLKVVYEFNPTFPFERIEALADDATTYARIKRGRVMLGQLGHARLLRIHRIYLPRAMQNDRYMITRTSALQQIEHLIQNSEQLSMIGLGRYWPSHYGLLTAVNANLVMLYYANPADRQRFAALAATGIESLRRCSGSLVLDESIDLLSTLHREICSRFNTVDAGIHSGMRKRKRADEADHPMLHLVKRVMTNLPAPHSNGSALPPTHGYSEAITTNIGDQPQIQDMDMGPPLDLAASPFNLYFPADLTYGNSDNILDDLLGYAMPGWNFNGLGPQLEDINALLPDGSG